MIEMEYADGGTLAQLLARSQNLLEEEQIGDMMIQMCSAVAYLHENSVLHRFDTRIRDPVTFFFQRFKNSKRVSHARLVRQNRRLWNIENNGNRDVGSGSENCRGDSVLYQSRDVFRGVVQREE